MMRGLHVGFLDQKVPSLRCRMLAFSAAPFEKSIWLNSAHADDGAINRACGKSLGKVYGSAEDMPPSAKTTALTHPPLTSDAR